MTMNAETGEGKGNRKALRFLPLVAGRLAVLALAFLMLAGSVNANCGISPSPLVLTCYPVNVVNTQGTATPNNFQLQLMPTPFNAIAGNVIVYNGLSGSPVLAWAENSVVMWLNLGANTIAPYGSANGIYYVGLGASTTNFFLAGNDIGEAPQLSSTYAKYDDGASVFPYYTNFAGTTAPSSITALGTGTTFNNGATVAAGDFIETTTKVYNTQTQIMDADISSITYGTSGDHAGISFVVSPSGGQYNHTSSYVAVASGTGDFYSGILNQFSTSSDFAVSSINAAAGSTSSSTSTSTGIWSLWATSSESYGSINYGTPLTVTSDIPPSGSYYIMAGASSSASTVVYQWLRTRAYPPNGVMPSVSFGAVQAMHLVPSISPNPATYGQSITLIATCPASTNTCAIDYPTLGTHLCTGTGSCTYTYMSGNLAAGSYSSYWANDITLGENSLPLTLTVNKDTPVLALTNCTNEAWTSAITGYSCLTTGSFTAINTILAENQLQATLTLNGAGVATSNIGANTTSNTIANTILSASYVLSTPAAANYIANSITVDWIGYTPIYLYNYSNTKYGQTYSNSILSNTITSWYYPLKIATLSPSNSIQFSSNVQFQQNAQQALQNGALNLSYLPPSNQLTGNYVFSFNEFQPSNPLSTVVNANQIFRPMNMTDMNGELSFVAQCAAPLQYFPNCAVFPYLANAFTVKPSSWRLQSDIAGNQHSNFTGITSNTDQWSNANLSFVPNILLDYPLYSFPANLINNPNMQKTITQTQGCSTSFFITQNTIPASPCTRKVMNLTSYDQGNLIPLNAITQVIQNVGFNNYTFSNTSTFTNTQSYVWMGNHTYQNPKINIVTLITSSTLAGYFQEINNWCPSSINSTSWKNIAIYLVPTSTGGSYTFDIQSNVNGENNGDYLQILKGVSASTAILVQQYLISTFSFPLPLLVGASYGFKILNGGCNQIYTTPFSTQSSPININIVQNISVPLTPLPKPIFNCVWPYNSLDGNYMVTCTGNDPTLFTTSWVLRLENLSTFPIPSLMNTTTIKGTSFSFTLQHLGAKAAYSMQITALQDGALSGISQTFKSFFAPITYGFGAPADGFIIFILLLIGAGAGIKGGEGPSGKQHQLSNTLFIEAFMIFIIYLLGLTAFVQPDNGFILDGATIAFLIFIGLIVHKAEGGIYYGG